MTIHFGKTFLCIVMLLVSISGWADSKWSISGKVADSETKEPIPMAGVRIMKPDSTYITGNATSEQGIFIVKPEKGGKMIVKITSIGYKTVYRDITLDKDHRTAALGTILLEPDAVALSEATITAKAAKVEVKGDTFQYNAAAYRVPEGAYLESLVEKLPGAVVDESGNITINGKQVKQIRIDGKDFFKGDNSVAMKNLPADLIEKIQAYDKKSDYTEMTGIDDGNEETVIDLKLKQKLKRAWFSNVDLSVGNKNRYADQLFATGKTENSRISFFGNLNNTNNRGFGGGGPGFRGGGNGLTATKRGGFNGFWNNGLRERDGGFFEIGGDINYGYTNSDNQNTSNSENFLADGNSSFGNSMSKSMGRNRNVNANVNLKWNPDSVTQIRFRPSFSYSKGDNTSNSRDVTFNSDPYKYSASPLDSIFRSTVDPLNVQAELLPIAVNRNERASYSDNNNTNFNGELNIMRRLNNSGRNISFRASGSYSSSHSYSYNLSNIYYYQQERARINNQYSVSPSTNWDYSLRLSYTEPIVKNLYLNTSYNYQHKFQDQDRNLYQLDSLEGYGYGNVLPEDYVLGKLPSGDSLYWAKSIENSRYATYHDDIHNVNVGFRYVTKEININAGVNMEPQRTKLEYQKDKLDTTVVRNVFKVSPNMRVRFNFSNVHRLELNYRGNSSQPSMTNLLDITDTSDPLNISMGNPGLKPSWTNNLNAEYSNYWRASQSAVRFRANYSNTQNSISTAITYDETTGVRTTRPENINGNWNAGLFGMFSSSFSDESPFSYFTMTDYNYNNSVGFMRVNSGNSQKNTMRTSTITERMRGSFRTGLFEFGLNGSITYEHSRSTLQTQADLDNYRFAYGGNIQYTTSFGFSVASNLSMNSRRGYSDASMNTNELLWNAQISQSLMKNKAATISLQFYDILHRQSNISRVINAQTRRDSRSNAINSYFMLHFIARLNVLGGTNGRIRPQGDRPDGEGPRPGGERRGGFGGGRPGGQGGFGGGPR
ncbi:MAG: TonB-dependent receptor [Prevotellaceae bacterium]|nr:TonB-dependent receptor [Prevotellaceae bacterium]